MELTEISERITSLETDRKNIFHQLDEIKEEVKDIHRLTSSVEKMAVKMDSTAQTVDKIDKRLDILENEPRDDFKHYKRLIFGCLITGVIGTIIGAVISLVIK